MDIQYSKRNQDQKKASHTVHLFLAPLPVRLTDGHLHTRVRLGCGLVICPPVDTDVDMRGIFDPLHGSCYTTVSTTPN